MSRLKLWKEDWDSAEKSWNEKATIAAGTSPLKNLKTLPLMQGITPGTAKHLKWKSFKWMVMHDTKKEVLNGFLQHPIKYFKTFVQSLCRPKPFQRKGDFFLYGVDSLEEFQRHLLDPDTILILGFSYCHKPFECPSGRFTDACCHDSEHPVCQQCFIGKATHFTHPKQSAVLYIPTVHYIGGKMFEYVHQNPDKKILFIITACELTLEMFGDWGNMVNIQGIGVRLDGRICNTMEAFALSERGIKPGLTVVLDDTKKQILDWIRIRNGLWENREETNLL